MSQHSTVFTIEKAIPAAEAMPELVPQHELRAPAPEPTSQPTGDASSASRRRPLRKLLLIGASLLAVAGASDFGWQYWTVGRFAVSTDDAYVKADNTTIAPKVSGYIAAVQVGDSEPVRAGQILARIDDRDYKVALEQTKADVAAAKANIANKQAALAA
jgi:membrane fusion protein (multidrug efflux system)